MVEMLVEAGADVNQVTLHGMNAAELAVQE